MEGVKCFIVIIAYRLEGSKYKECQKGEGLGGRLKMANTTITGSKGYGVAFLNSSTNLGFNNNTINTSTGYPLFIPAAELNASPIAEVNHGKQVLVAATPVVDGRQSLPVSALIAKWEHSGTFR